MCVLFIESGSGYGGSARCLSFILKFIGKEKVQPMVLYYSFGPNIKNIMESGISAKKCSLARLILSIMQTDIVYINNEIYSHTLNIILAKILKKKCICHMRGIRPFVRRERFVAKLVDKFVAVSQKCKDNLINEGIPKQKIWVIYDALEIETTLQKKSDCVFSVGVVSRIVPNKGHFTLVQAAEILFNKGLDVRFLIFGDDTDLKRVTLGELSKFIHNRKMDKVVNLMGWLTNAKAIYEQFDIAVCPSELQESFGMNVAEAMAFQKPVIASNIGAYSELIQDGVNGLLFEPGNAKDLAQKIELLINDRILREKLVINAYDKAKEKFDIKKNVLKLEQLIYEQI